ncbi:MAG TPA: hypothetical protein VK053_25250 [Jiangellaceae bacterium]|nr:hypothetical protein [Jiangellaceae bacterium]
MLQMSASALTAVSATALLSFLGLWGTVLGMGLLSILTVLGNYMYSTSIQRTAEKVKQVRPVTPRIRGRYPEASTDTRVDDATRVDLEPVTAESVGQDPADSTEPGDEDEPPAGRLRTIWNSMVERYGVRRIVLSIVAVFVILAGTITVIELAAGKPMTDIVRNDSGSGTSVFGGSTSDGSGTDDSTDTDGDGSSDPDGDSDQQAPQDGEPQDGEPPAEEPQDGEPQDGDPQDGEPPAEDPQDFGEPPPDEPPADEPPADDGGGAGGGAGGDDRGGAGGGAGDGDVGGGTGGDGGGTGGGDGGTGGGDGGTGGGDGGGADGSDD